MAKQDERDRKARETEAIKTTKRDEQKKKKEEEVTPKAFAHGSGSAEAKGRERT